MLCSVLPAQAQTPAPYLLPYTINTYLGGGTAPHTGDPCQGQSTPGTAADGSGDGCLIGSTSLLVGSTYSFDVAVDGPGNIYFVDGTSSSKAAVRKIEARSGLVHVFTGASGHVCTGIGISKYGDGCQANDGLANLSANYTISFSAQCIYAAKNGDVYIAGSDNVVHKISAATGLMTVVAGFLSGTSGASGYTGDGGAATNAEVGSILGIALDAAGNMYLADNTNNVIRKVDTNGIITTFAGHNPGNNTAAPAGYTGDLGPATSATFTTPTDVEVDAFGNVYVGEFGNKSVRVVYAGGAQVANLIALNNPSITAAQVQVGYIYSIVGRPAEDGSSSSGKLGTGFKPGSLRKIALDAHNNVWLSDGGNEIVSMLDAQTGYVRYIAGVKGCGTNQTTITNGVLTCSPGTGTGCATALNDVLGDGCPATQATLKPGSAALGATLDSLGNVYIDDGGNNRLRKVSTGQTFGTVAAGSSVIQTLLVHLGPNDTAAALSPFTITNNSNGAADFTLTSTTCASSGFDTTTDCTLTVTYAPTAPGASLATLTANTTLGATASFPLSGIAIAPAVALDPGTPAVVGTSLTNPASMAQDGAGNTYVADTGNNRILRYSVGGSSTVISGGGTFSGPKGVGVGQDGAVYVADTGNNLIKRIDPITGAVTTVAGGASSNCASATDSFGDGCPGTQVQLSSPSGIAVDTVGNVYIADTGHSLIRELTPSGYVFFVAGGATSVCGSDPYGNGCNPSKAILKNPTGLQLDGGGNLYIADTGNSEIRELVGATNIINVIAGQGQAGGFGDTGPAIAAQLNAPTGVAVDAAGDVYIADTGNHAIRFVNASGNINTIAGTLGVQGTGTMSSAFSILLSSPASIVVSGSGSAYILDSGNSRLLSLTRSLSTYSFGLVNPGNSSPVARFQETSTGSTPVTLPSPVFASTSLFSITPSGFNGCTPGQNLTSGESCYLSGQFNPAVVGPASTTVAQTAISTNLPSISAPVVTLNLSGTGVTLTPTGAVNTVTNPATGNPTFGSPFTVTTTVTPTACSATATNCALIGTVTFYADGVAVGLPVPISSVTTGGMATGTAQEVFSGQSVGSHSITAVYTSGDANYESSTAPAITVIVVPAATTTSFVPTPATLLQFQALTLTATVNSSVVGTLPTGGVTFYAGTTALGTAGLIGGVATLVDANPPTTLGLIVGNYNIKAVYAGDTNFLGSTSSTAPVSVHADPVAISLLLVSDTGSGPSASTGTAQGSTAAVDVLVTPTNTVNDTLTFACSNLPQNSVCTFQALDGDGDGIGVTTLTFTAVPGAAAPQLAQVTLWTDIAPGVIPTAHAARTGRSASSLFGWPVLLLSLAGLLGMRRRLLHARILSVIALFGLLVGGSIALNGCGSGQVSALNLTPTGTYTVTLTVSGPHTPAQTAPIFFTVGPGLPGQQ